MTLRGLITQDRGNPHLENVNKLYSLLYGQYIGIILQISRLKIAYPSFHSANPKAFLILYCLYWVSA